MKINPNYTLRSIAGETIIVNQGSSHTDMTRIISLNATARFLWEQLVGKDNFTLDEAARLLADEYDISREQAAGDVAKWAERLKECGGILEN